MSNRIEQIHNMLAEAQATSHIPVKIVSLSVINHMPDVARAATEGMKSKHRRSTGGKNRAAKFAERNAIVLAEIGAVRKQFRGSKDSFILQRVSDNLKPKGIDLKPDAIRELRKRNKSKKC